MKAGSSSQKFPGGPRLNLSSIGSLTDVRQTSDRRLTKMVREYFSAKDPK